MNTGEKEKTIIGFFKKIQKYGHLRSKSDDRRRRLDAAMGKEYAEFLKKIDRDYGVKYKLREKDK